MSDRTRTILAGVAGVVIAVVVVAIVEAMAHVVYAPPPGTDLSSPAAIEAFVQTMPVGAFLFILAAYVAGTIAGGLAAAAIARRQAMRLALVIGGLILFFSAINFATIPHPAWFIVATVAGVSLVAVATGRLGGAWLAA